MTKNLDDLAARIRALAELDQTRAMKAPAPKAPANPVEKAIDDLFELVDELSDLGTDTSDAVEKVQGEMKAMKALLAQLSQTQPMDRVSEGIDFGESLFLDGRNHNLDSLLSGRLQNPEGELAVSGNQTDFFFVVSH